MNKIDFDVMLSRAREWLQNHSPRVSAETLGWIAVIIIHAATIPSLLALMTGLSDDMPGVDVVLFVWTGLILLFIRSVVLKDVLNTVTIGVGFMLQACVMALIIFK